MSSGRLENWPEWPEFRAPVALGEDHTELQSYKKRIVEKYGQDSIRKGWLKVCEMLVKSTEKMAKEGTSMIPTMSFEEFQKLDDDAKANLKATGCFVIRNVIQQEEAKSYFKDLKKLVADNEDKITGM
jgi:hypothetical protein